MSIASELTKTALYLRNTRKAILGRGGEIGATAGLKDLPDAVYSMPCTLQELIDVTLAVSYMFKRNITDEDFDQIASTLDFSKVELFNYAFEKNLQITTVTQITNTKKAVNVANMFTGCSYLETVKGIVMPTGTGIPASQQNALQTNMFYNCKKLTNLELNSIYLNLTVGSGSTYGHLLTVESLVGLIRELVANTSTYHTLTVGSANLAKLADVYVKPEKNTASTGEKIPFEVCESTEEGAMLITDYALIKNWGIN